MTLLTVGGMLNIPVPRRLVRELGWTGHQRVYVERAKDGALVVTALDDYLRERRDLRARPPR